MLPQRHQNETHLAKVDFAKYALSPGREHTFSMLEGPGRLAGGTRRLLGRPSRATLGLQEDIGKLSWILEAKSTENELILDVFWGQITPKWSPKNDPKKSPEKGSTWGPLGGFMGSYGGRLGAARAGQGGRGTSTQLGKWLWDPPKSYILTQDQCHKP